MTIKPLYEVNEKDRKPSKTIEKLINSGYYCPMSLFGDATVSLLDAGKRFSAPGIGLSSRARAFNNQFLSQTRNGLNTILSAGVAGGGSIEGIQTQILALRARFSDNQLAPSLRAEDSVPVDGNVGSNVDIES